MDYQETHPGAATPPGMTGSGTTKGPVGAIKDDAQRLAREARQGTAQVANRALEQAEGAAEQTKDQAANRVNSLASAVRQAGQQLESEDAAMFGRYAGIAADELDKVSSWLRQRDMKDLVRDTETFARRHPDLFMGGAFFAGLLLARFLKSSTSGGESGESMPMTTSAPLYEPTPAPFESEPVRVTGAAVAPSPFPATTPFPTNENGGL
jgi:hypothetical protein